MSISQSADVAETLEPQLMALAFQRSGACFVFQDQELQTVMIRNPPAALFVNDSDLASDVDLFGVDEARRLRKTKTQILQDGQVQSIEIDKVNDTGTATFHIRIERISHAGRTGLLSIINDITESRHRERVLKTLLREVSHRSKNLLAIIQGIATQTARQALSLDTFLVKFRGRIQSLSNSQDLVTDSSWRGAFLFELAYRQLAPYWPDLDRAMPFNGINAHLSPNAALHLGLALHELIVNSASHGAISVAADTLTISCSETVLRGEKAITIAWVEQRVASDAPEREDSNAFARTVLKRAVPSAIGGTALYLEEADRVEYHLTVPQHEFEILEP